MSEPPPRSPEQGLGPWGHGGILLLFFLLVALYTYPLILDPARLVPDHHDPSIFAWVMISNAHRLLTAPLALFHGNAFYPHGNTLTYSELLLTPTLTAGPIYYLTGNPLLAYNLTLLLFWALSGWAMFFCAYALTGSLLPALLAGIAFSLSPYRTDYYLEFQMQLSFPIPLAVLFTSRFLERQRGRDLALALLMIWLQALASWYYAIILSLALGLFAIFFLLLRWDGWRGTTLAKLLTGGGLLGAALTPFAWPYFETHRELNFERGLQEAANHSADLLTYLETGVTKLYSFSPTGHIAETSLFMGFTALALAGISLVWLRRRNHQDTLLRWAQRLTTAGTWLCLGGLLLAFRPTWIRAIGIRPPRPLAFFVLLLFLALLRLFIEGWARTRGQGGERALTQREWIMILLGLGLFFFLLSLGPIIHYGRQPMGRGLFAYLYNYLEPLHILRVTTRFGVMVVFALSLLAGFGLQWVMDRLPAHRARWLAAALVLALLTEYWSFPLPYIQVDWNRLPEVYRVLAQDREDVAVLEWPMDVSNLDARYMFYSLAHWKRLVNGFSGFVPDLSREISAALAEGGAEAREPALAFLRAIHPLRYLIVHNQWLSAEDRARWERFGMTPGVHWLGRYGSDNLYRLDLDERGGRIEKLFSYDYLRTRRHARFRFRPIGPEAPARQWIEVAFNGRPLQSLEMDAGWSEVTLSLLPPFRVADANRLTLTHHYRRPRSPSPRYQIGQTGVESPVDIHVVSGGKYYGWTSWILINGVDYSPNLRGYNLVAIARNGEILDRAVFDTFASPEESHRLARFIEVLPAGTIVVASVKDEAEGQITEDAVLALHSLGGKEDLRGRLWLSHLLIGVKGAPPGTAIELAGRRRLEHVVGVDRRESMMVVRDFRLE